MAVVAGPTAPRPTPTAPRHRHQRPTRFAAASQHRRCAVFMLLLLLPSLVPAPLSLLLLLVVVMVVANSRDARRPYSETYCCLSSTHSLTPAHRSQLCCTPVSVWQAFWPGHLCCSFTNKQKVFLRPCSFCLDSWPDDLGQGAKTGWARPTPHAIALPVPHFPS